MERVRRRWWTRAVSVLAALVVLSAVLSGLFQLAVLTLPSYRADLSAWVTEVAKRPVQIGGVNLGWRGLAPRLDLDDITLYSEDGNESLTLERLSLGFSLLRLATGNVFPYRLEVSGLQLLVELDANDEWRVAGFGADDGSSLSPQQREALARDLQRFRRLTLRNCTLLLSGPRFGKTPQEVRLGRLDIEQRAGGVDVDARLRLPATHGEKVLIAAEIDGELAHPQTWAGEFELSAENLRPQGWVAGWLQPGVQIGAQDFALEVDGAFGKGRLQRAALAVDSGPLLLARSGQSSGAKTARLRADLRAETDGWSIGLRELRFDDEALARGIARWRRLGGGHGLDVDAEELRIGRLTPWLAVWRETPALLAQADRLSGTLRNVVLRLRTAADVAPRYSLAARLDGVALADRGRAGFAKLSGELSANESGGQLRVRDVPLQLNLPSLFGQVLEIDNLRALAQWRRVSDGWRLSSSEFSWRALDTSGRGRLQLERPDDPERSTLIDLDAEFSGNDLRTVKPYMLKHWPQSLQDWLQRALVKGRATRGELAIKGPLRDFPYHKRPTGAWRLDLDLANATLAFSPDWPVLTTSSAHLNFSGNGLRVETRAAQLGGNTIDRASAVFADFNEGLLQIDAHAFGDVARFYDVLRASPLRKRFAGLLNQTRAAGAAQLELNLALPVHKMNDTQVRGAITLDEAQMFYAGLAAPISGISGALRFDMQGVAGEGLVGRFEDLPLAIRIEPRAETHGVVIADFTFVPHADGSGASQFVPVFLRDRIDGASRWRAELPLRDRDVALTLTSELVGTALDLPEPLGKPAESARRIALRIGGDAAAPLRIGLAYAELLQGDLAFGKPAAVDGAPAANVPTLQGLRARFGSEAPPQAVAGEFIVDGRAETMDVSAWIAMLSAGSGGEGPRIDSVDLDIDHLRWRDQLSAATRLRYRPQTGSGWRVHLDGVGAQGQLDWSGPAPGRLVARLEHLLMKPSPNLLAPPPSDAAAAPPVDPGPPIDPARLPEFDVGVMRVSGNGADLGRVVFKSSRIAGGQKIDQLVVGGGIVDLTASGQWRRVEARSSAELRYSFKSSDVEAVLKALAYEPNLAARSSESSGELSWSPSPTGLFWHAAAGRVVLAADNGQLRAVKPGASRVLGLINFFTLPRRLTLNFRDVVDEGLAFDKIRGHFTLGGGGALTDDLGVVGPSLRMDVRGRIGLAARDYDQRITVYPGVSSGVTLGAALLGGPAVGAVVLLAQELLDKPLDQVTQLTYHVSGSWDNPSITRGEARSLKPAEVRKR